MSKPTVFVDGQEGTTGLEIYERLAGRADLELLRIAPDKRKDAEARRALLNACDVAFLCLPDVAAREAVALVTNPAVRIIDASTAYRTDPAWVYGFPELDPRSRAAVRGARRISVPGCYATGFVALVRPLIAAGVLAPDTPITCHAISGYSGGGKKLIAAYEGPDRTGDALKAPRPYALGLQHKHLPEMRTHAGLRDEPVFSPVVADFYRGMVVAVPLPVGLLARRLAPTEVREALAAHYAGERFVQVLPFDNEANAPGGFFDPTACNRTNRLDLGVFGRPEQMLLMARLDNLGKGASGAAVQCMNLVLGVDEGTGL